MFPYIYKAENFKYKPDIAGVNNFSLWGVNAHVLLIIANHKTLSEGHLGNNL